MINEELLEENCIAWFKELGYEYASGYDIAPGGENPARDDYHRAVLRARLLPQLAALNPDVPTANLEQVAESIGAMDSPALLRGNRDFYRQFIEGVKIEYQRGDKTEIKYVRLVDFVNVDANEFLVVNQFTVQGAKNKRRADIVVFVNGLPLAVIELKDPKNENTDIWDAYRQLQTYQEDIPELFICNAALVISDGLFACVGSLCAEKGRFMPWRTMDNENHKPKLEMQLEVLVKGFFQKGLWLDYLRHFILFTQTGGMLEKKIAAYHQFHAAREAVKATLIASNKNQVTDARADYADRVQPGSGKAGVIWHTQGSGKSISMVCYAGKLVQQAEMKNPTLVVVTDRNDLDGQLFDTFTSAADILKQTPKRAESREDLREMLNANRGGGIIFTTIQKFQLREDETRHAALCSRDNVVVISDEAHRSQYGHQAKLSATGKYRYGYAKHLRDALPNATFIGFTGTPIETNDHNTRAVFGEYVSIYDIKDAVDDGATVEILYESRLAKLDINRAEMETLNEQVEEIVEEEDFRERERTKSKWASLEKLVGAAPRLQQVAEDLVKHFAKRDAVLPGKAMVVCMSRDICVRLYDEIVKLHPAWHSADVEKGNIKIVMTGGATDAANIRRHAYTKEQRKRLEKRFKDADDDLKMVILCDMWLTGFDAPACHTMYLDKPMHGHNLMQAIARVNRVFKDKKGGLVVDYIGIVNALKHALAIYTGEKGKGKLVRDNTCALEMLREKLDVIRAMFAAPNDANPRGFDYADYETRALELLPPAVNHLLGHKDGKKRFLDAMSELQAAYSLCNTLDEVDEHKTELAFFGAMKAAIMKHAEADGKRIEAKNDAVLQRILDNAIYADGVEDIFKLAGVARPNIHLLSAEFLEDVKKTPHKNLAVELLRKLLLDNIKHKMRNDVVQEKTYSERIQETLRKYHNRAIETAQVIEELIQMARDLTKDLEADAKLSALHNMNADEIAFYRALIQNESAVRELGDNNLRELAKYVTDKLRKSTTVDWRVRDDVRAKLRLEIRDALAKWKYPPDDSDEAIALCMKQAEALSESWDV